MSNKAFKHYFDLNEPTAFSSAAQIKKVHGIDVDRELSKAFSYSINRQRRYKFKRLKTIPVGFMTDIQVDLADFRKLTKFNKKYAYCLVMVDVLSRQIFTKPMRRKNAEEMKEAFKELIETMPKKPLNIFSDKGREFDNKIIKDFLKEHGIEKRRSEHEATKASVCERFIRVIKSRLYKYMDANSTKIWYNVLPKITFGINHSYSRAIKTTPASINNTNWWPLWKSLYSYKQETHRAKFNVGEVVRVAYTRGKFDKGYISNFSDEVFKIRKVNFGYPVTYVIEDLNKLPLPRRYYNQELSLSDESRIRRVKKILRKREVQGNTEYLVQWLDLPSEYNSWITDIDERKILPGVTE